MITTLTAVVCLACSAKQPVIFDIIINAIRVVLGV